MICAIYIWTAFVDALMISCIMYAYCLSFILLVSVCSGFRLDEFTQPEDYNAFFDMVLALMKKTTPAYLNGPPLNLDITLTGTSDPIGSFSGPTSYFGDFSTVKRTTPVDYSLSWGALTLVTSVAFDILSVRYPDSTIRILQQYFEIAAKVDVKKNQFLMNMTVHSDKDGSCTVNLTEAKFTTIGNANMEFVPRGFFNQVNLNANMSSLFQNVLDYFNDFNTNLIEESLKRAICSVTS